MLVIGVTEPGFHGVDLGYNPQVLVPVTMKKQMTPGWNAMEDRRSRWVQIFARLKPGVTAERAQAALRPFYKALIHDEGQAGSISKCH